MIKRISIPLCSLAIFLVIGNHYNSEFIVWISVAMFGVIIIEELLTPQKTGNEDINNSLILIISKLNQIMTKQERLDLAIANLNEGTNAIAADLKKLQEELAAGNVSEESLAALETNIAVLTELGNAQ